MSRGGGRKQGVLSQLGAILAVSSLREDLGKNRGGQGDLDFPLEPGAQLEIPKQNVDPEDGEIMETQF